MVYDILFVCTGNTCRSPMAKALFEKLNTSKGYNFKVLSCGIYVPSVSGASKNSIDTMKKFDIDITSHKSTQITKEHIINSKIILTMTRDHKHLLTSSIEKQYIKNIYTLYEYTKKEDKDISDPYGKDIESYFLVAKEIKHLLEKIDIS